MRKHAFRILILYAAGLTAIAGWFAVLRPDRALAKVDTLDVQRINLREADGTLRMVISNRGRFPGLIVRNVDRPHSARRDSAGMIFLNDEGTENGGLIFGGTRSSGGASSFGHLSFDQYEQDQVASLEQIEENGRRKSGLTVSDRPDASIDVAAMERVQRLPEPQRQAAIERLKASGSFGRRRLFIGKDASRASLLELHDDQGRIRLRLQVSPDGAANIQFLDASGKVTKTVQP